MTTAELGRDILETRLDLLQRYRGVLIAEMPLGWQEQVAGIDLDFRETKFILDTLRECPITEALREAVLALEAR